jgi:hypothetical protein
MKGLRKLAVVLYLVMMFLCIVPVFLYFLFKADKRREMWNKFLDD